jgi:hypothetical protein
MNTLFDMLKCVRCHQFGSGDGAVDAADLAPDLSLTSGRLKPEWVESWMKNPQALEQGTRMPNFFIEIDEDDGEVMELLPEPEKKIDLLVRYLFSMS